VPRSRWDFPPTNPGTRRRKTWIADPEDLSDIEFLMKNEPVTEAQLRSAFECLRLPDIQELRDAFRAAQPKVLALVKR
jgi:hypothetical protein